MTGKTAKVKTPVRTELAASYVRKARFDTPSPVLILLQPAVRSRFPSSIKADRLLHVSTTPTGRQDSRQQNEPGRSAKQGTASITMVCIPAVSAKSLRAECSDASTHADSRYPTACPSSSGRVEGRST